MEKETVKMTKEELRKEIISWIVWMVSAVLAALILNRTILVNAHVDSGSMEKTIMTGDRILGLRTSFWFSDPQRFDIIVFENPKNKDDAPYVKRIIGLPGETFEMKDGKVYINDALLDDSSFVWEDENRLAKPNYKRVTIPEGHYFMLGDNRRNSSDSRDWGFLVREDIIGKVYIRLFPNILILK